MAHSVRSQRCLYRRQHQEATSEMEQDIANDPTSLNCLGSKAIRSAGSTRKDSWVLNIARLFSVTPRGTSEGKTSNSGAPTMDWGLFPWSSKGAFQRGQGGLYCKRRSFFKW
jgi:hypothetical protein